ncbi:MAG: hypothetical protein AB7U82_03205 [Blastocatellales bacterium]
MKLASNLAVTAGMAVALAVLISSARAQNPGEGFSAPPRTSPTILPVRPRRNISPRQDASKRDKSGESVKFVTCAPLRETLILLAIKAVAGAVAKNEKSAGVQSDQLAPASRPVLKQATERAQYRSPNEILRSARTLFVRSRSGFFEGQVFEREILKRSEKERLELVVTRDEAEADLIVEVYRKKFSTRFVFSLIEPGTKRIVASDKSSSLGGDIEPDLANLLIKKFKAARQ